ncbi:MAG: hypothetical protein HOF11_15380 [Rhodospirillaceae bacterium]|jgi:hypothetical protein|nr:hypothetical protein [Rhodospirillaceae bacterium]
MATDTISDSDARWLPVSDAAAVLGVSDEILRLRMSRQAIGTRVDPDGRVFVRTPYDLTDYIRAGVTAPVAEEEAANSDDWSAENATPDQAPVDETTQTAPKAPIVPEAPTAPAHQLIEPLQALNEARIAELKAIIVEMTGRHNAEIERLMESHQAEMQRLVDLHNISTKMLHEQAQHTAKIEAEGKSMLIGVIGALDGRK